MGGELLRDAKGVEPKTQSGRLRYGRLLLMCDQDEDGSHIKGLLLSYLHYFWPSLLGAAPNARRGDGVLSTPDEQLKGAIRTESFVQQFVTPIVKAKVKTSGRRRKQQQKQGETRKHDSGSAPAVAGASSDGDDALSGAAGERWFYSLDDYHAWRHGLEQRSSEDVDAGDASDEAGGLEQWAIKYYKGLGTNTSAEAKQYFQQHEKHTVAFEWDGNAAAEAIDLGEETML